MPYAFENKRNRFILKQIDKDRRIKLSPADKEQIKKLYQEGNSIRGMARSFKVDKRLIQFILFPERLELNKKLRQERGGSKQYYDKKYYTKAIKEHRNYKYKIYKEKIMAYITESDLNEIKRIAVRAVQENTLQSKQDALWQILDIFNYGPEDITNANPPSYWEDKG